jgi:hypothetical protein
MMDVPLDLQHAARSICRWMAENNVANWRLDHLASRDELERVEKELTELRAFKQACEEHDAVAMVDEGGIIIVTAYTYKPGDVLYIKPDPEAAKLRLQVAKLTEQRDLAVDALKKLLQRDMRNTCQHEETHRGGVIWEICDSCGASWEDHLGGKPEWKDPIEWVHALAAIQSIGEDK